MISITTVLLFLCGLFSILTAITIIVIVNICKIFKTVKDLQKQITFTHNKVENSIAFNIHDHSKQLTHLTRKVTALEESLLELRKKLKPLTQIISNEEDSVR